MEATISHFFALALSPFTSQTLLLQIPAAFAFIFGCVSLVFYLIRRA